MSLLGLVVSLFGFGAMAKDAISDAIDDGVKSSRAESKGEPVYYVNGRIQRSTKTGRDCDVWRMDDNHYWVIDRKTREKVEDYTAWLNAKKTAENKAKALANGNKFYRTAEFDGVNGAWSAVYVCDDYPGKYFEESDNWDHGRIKHKKIYSEGTVVDYVKNRKRVKEFTGDKKFECYEDGTVRTPEYVLKNQNDLTRDIAISKGEKYYYCDEGKEFEYLNRYKLRDVETDELAYHDNKNDYYTKGKLVGQQVQAKPHHAEMKTVYKVVEVPGETRYNLDGTLWVE